MSNHHEKFSDLQLEDVEDYSADYPPAGGGYPNSQANMAPVGNSDEEGYSIGSMNGKGRRSSMHAMVRNNKWTAAVLGVVLIVLIGVLAATVGKDNSQSSNASGLSNDGGDGVTPVVIDDVSVDQDVLATFKASIEAVYDRHGLDISLLQDGADTPQRKSLVWMSTDPNVNTIEHTEKLQRFVLGVFFYATNSVPTINTEQPEAWRAAENWMSTAHSCDWMGVLCNDDKDITSMDLERNRLSGAIPPDMAIVGKHMETLDFTSNLISMRDSDFDVFLSMPNLKTLLMDDNYLYHDSGLPPQFASLVNLEKLRLSYNLFEGGLESGDQPVLGAMTKLTHLEVESNFFTGTMPDAIANMNQLVYLYMRRNDMSFNLDFLKSGQLLDLCEYPFCVFVGDLFYIWHLFYLDSPKSSLLIFFLAVALWLDSNGMTGTIPTEIGLLTDLASISLTNSTLSGTIPTEIGALTQLRRLWLYNNDLTGQIPDALNNLPLLEVVELHSNEFVGDMPAGVCTSIGQSDYEYKSLTSDCVSEVSCDTPACCTECF